MKAHVCGGPVGSVRSALLSCAELPGECASTNSVQGFGEEETLFEAYLIYESYISWKALVLAVLDLHFLTSCCMYTFQ